MTIYLDIVFFENLILNYIIILSTAIISKSHIYLGRIIIASSIGGIFAILNYIANLNLLTSFVLKILISILIIIIAFRNYNYNSIIKQLIFFYLVSFTFGGIAFMLLFFIDPHKIIMKGNYFVGTYPIKVTILSAVIGFIIINIVTQLIKARLNKKSMIYELEIFYEGKSKKIKTMLDTGNLLKEPISNADVIIVEKESLIGVLDEDIIKNISQILNGKWIDNSSIHSYKFKLIPFTSLGNENGLLIGFKPDYVKIYKDEEVLRDDVIIGIYDGKLSKTNLYTSLIGLEILKTSKKARGTV